MTEPCSCYKCTEIAAAWAIREDESVLGDIFFSLKWFGRMFLCSICGNKRCPHATDHELTCTGSNEPGQKGSSYE